MGLLAARRSFGWVGLGLAVLLGVGRVGAGVQYPSDCLIGFAVGGVCFLVLPLRFAFERPVAMGWYGALFEIFRNLDQPYNLFPSLHITLRTLLADLYARHTRGSVYVMGQVWFSLIGLSTVLTYQHHIVDVLGGFALAAVCFYLFREMPIRLPVMPNPRVGAYYGLGAALLLGLAAATWPWGSWLLWPGAALSIVTTAYYGVGPGIFRKHAGRLPLSTWVLLGPVLLGQYLSLQYYRRQCRPWDAVMPGVLIGRKLSDAEAQEAVRQGVTAVLDLTGEFSEARPFLSTTYRNLPILDLTASSATFSALNVRTTSTGNVITVGPGKTLKFTGNVTALFVAKAHELPGEFLQLASTGADLVVEGLREAAQFFFPAPESLGGANRRADITRDLGGSDDVSGGIFDRRDG